jgi:hydrogenase small subunit
MLIPRSIPWPRDLTLAEHLERQGVSRRDFLAFCGQVGVMLGLGSLAGPRIAEALSQQRRPSAVWLSLQECTGCTESVLRSADPTIGELVLDLLSLDFQENLMAAAGEAAEGALHQAMEANRGSYILLVTGGVPLAEDGIYTTIGGRTAKEILEEAADGAAAVIAIGACAHWGNIQASHPNPTGAVGVGDVVKGKPVVNIAGCPPIADVVTATVAHYLTFGRIPDLDAEGRPLFAYGTRIHDQCPKRANYDAGQFVEAFDDEAARKGWCLYKVGCKGPVTFSPCPIFMWNSRTDWPIGAGHGCVGCSEANFWDTMSPFYERLPKPPGFGVTTTADQIGLAVVGATAVGFGAHGIAKVFQHRRDGDRTEEETPAPGRQHEGGDG